MAASREDEEVETVKEYVADAVGHRQPVATAQGSGRRLVGVDDTTGVVGVEGDLPRQKTVVVTGEDKPLPVRPEASRAPHLGTQPLQRVARVDVHDDGVRRLRVPLISR